MHASRNENLVSVLFPVYKPDFDLLDEALRSILDQDYGELEVVVVEDPSERPGREVVEGFKDPRIRYTLNRDRTSLTDQLNQGIVMSRGGLIARMDADDVSLPGRLSRQAGFMAENPGISVVGTNIEAMDEKGASLGYRRYPERHEEIARAMSIYCPMAHPTVMFRGADVLAVGGYREPAPIEDWDLWCRLLKSGRRFHNIQEPLLRYRIHARAGKASAVKKTLLTSIDIKERHFKGLEGRWGVRERVRVGLERLLVMMPGPLVMRLFMLHTFRKRP